MMGIDQAQVRDREAQREPSREIDERSGCRLDARSSTSLGASLSAVERAGGVASGIDQQARTPARR